MDLRRILLWAFAVVVGSGGAIALAPPRSSQGTRMLDDYFRRETARLEERCLAGIDTAEEWNARKGEYRRQLTEMLGLTGLPRETGLKPVVAGVEERDGVRLEKVQFQSLPGLYVTGSLFLPRALEKPAPAVLYVCGHANTKKDGISYGAKDHYQHHGAWLAQNGYVCLMIDSLENGEIEGNHHGTYRDGLWWWNARGYTPAGVETWNSIRALDYLESRPEVDGTRIGLTGRSGGGAYTWFVAALDDRVKVAVPVAGITDLRNHVVDGAVEGHCDCMYPVNTYRWDYAQLAALVAPRPLLIENSDKDRIFPLDGVVRVHAKVRRIYELLGAADRLGLTITEGPHRDTQELQVPALRWLNRFLKDENPLLETAARPLFTPEELRVLPEIPRDERNTTIDARFVAAAESPGLPPDAKAWDARSRRWLDALRSQVFAGWPESAPPLDLHRAHTAGHQGVRLRAFDFDSQEGVRLRLYVAHHPGVPLSKVRLHVLDEAGWRRWLSAMEVGFAEAMAEESAGKEAPSPDPAGWTALRKEVLDAETACAWIAPRGIGLTAWDGDARKEVQIRRRFMLLGQTLDGMRIWDVRRALQALADPKGARAVHVEVQAEGEAAGIALYAALFGPAVERLTLTGLPRSHREGPDLLNVLRFLDLPQAVALAASRVAVTLRQPDEPAWDYPRELARRFDWRFAVGR